MTSFLLISVKTVYNSIDRFFKKRYNVKTGIQDHGTIARFLKNRAIVPWSCIPVFTLYQFVENLTLNKNIFLQLRGFIAPSMKYFHFRVVRPTKLKIPITFDIRIFRS